MFNPLNEIGSTVWLNQLIIAPATACQYRHDKTDGAWALPLIRGSLELTRSRFAVGRSILHRTLPSVKSGVASLVAADAQVVGDLTQRSDRYRPARQISPPYTGAHTPARSFPERSERGIRFHLSRNWEGNESTLACSPAGNGKCSEASP
jgi:hypothetical protein